MLTSFSELETRKAIKSLGRVGADIADVLYGILYADVELTSAQCAALLAAVEKIRPIAEDLEFRLSTIEARTAAYAMSCIQRAIFCGQDPEPQHLLDAKVYKNSEAIRAEVEGKTDSEKLTYGNEELYSDVLWNIDDSELKKMGVVRPILTIESARKFRASRLEPEASPAP